MELWTCLAWIAVTVYGLNYILMTRWSRRGFAQLDPTFLIGDIGQLLMGKKSIAFFLHEKCLATKKNSRALGLYFSLRANLLINDPLLIQDILIRDFNNFHDRPFYVDEKKNPLTGHLFSLPGQKWRDLRVKLTPAFTTGKLKGMFPIINDCAKVLETYLVKNVEKGIVEHELGDLFTRYTTNIISSVAFGIENDCINERDHIFYQISKKISKPSFKKGISDILAMFVPFVSIRAVDQEIEDFFFSIVEQTIEHREKTNFSRKDFMQLMIELKNQGFVSSDKGSDENVEVNARKMKVSEIAAQVFVFIVAGEVSKLFVVESKFN
jgi:cytochrome P450 family 6